MQKITTYKLPFYKRFARYYEFYKNLILSLLGLLVSAIIIFLLDIGLWKLLLLVPSIIITIRCIVKLFKYIHANSNFDNWVSNQKSTSNHVSEYTGPPGTGKTLMQNLSTYFMAKYSWEELQFEYWLLLPKFKNPDFVPNEDESEIIQAYNFYINNKGIPCLASNVPIYSYEYDRHSYILTAEHLKQEERVPYRLVGAIDEMGTVCNLEMYKDRSNNYGGSADMADFFRFCRQFAEMRCIGTEQEATNVYKDVRRVTAEIIKFKGVEPVQKPVFFNRLYNKRKKKYIEDLDVKQSLKHSRKMLKLKRFLDNCGFLKIRYVYLTETGKDAEGKTVYNEKTRDNGKDYILYVPCAMPIKYITRAYRPSYRALDKPLRLAVYEKLSLSKESSSKMLKAETLRLVAEERDKAKAEEDKRKYIEKIKLKEEMRQSAKAIKSNINSTKKC